MSTENPDTESTNITENDIKDILDELHAITNAGNSHYRVFSDWIDLMLVSLQRDDDAHQQLVSPYVKGDQPGSKEAITHYADAFGLLQARTDQFNHDVLGEVYETFGMQSDRLGQHFTPHNLSDFLAETTMSKDANIEEDRPPRVADPACGSGRLLVSCAKHVSPDAFFHGIDKDELCAKMTVLNLCLFNMNGLILQGDALTREYTHAWETTRTPTGGRISELPLEKLEQPHSGTPNVDT